VENLLARTYELTGKMNENVEKNRELAQISKRLATIVCDAPCDVELDKLKVQPMDDEKVKQIFVEFEFNSIGRRLFGEEFKAGRGFQAPPPAAEKTRRQAPAKPSESRDLVLTGETERSANPLIATVEQPSEIPVQAELKTLAAVPHQFAILKSAAERARLINELKKAGRFAFYCVDSSTPGSALHGIAFSMKPHTGSYVELGSKTEAEAILHEFRPVFESEEVEKTGHNLKAHLRALRNAGVSVRGKLFDTMIAHSLVEPDMRHSQEYLAEAYLGYSLVKQPEGGVAGELGALGISPIDFACERAEANLRLRASFEPLLKEKGQERVFYEIEAPLIPVLMEMEFEGIKVDATALSDFGAQLAKEIADLEKSICRIAGSEINVNSPKQLGHVLFEVLKICEKPKKTKTGQYATDEQTLMSLAPDHEIVGKLLEHRAASKLKSTYADALPVAISSKTGRIHTTFQQVATATGRLNSQDPNLQNIPIRSERGQEIRKAFVPRGKDYKLLSADYSQIELRIIASISKEKTLIEAFKTGADVHTATAAKVFGVFPELVTAQMRSKAKMVNYGIAYGISAFGLAQRLGIPRKEAIEIIDSYFKQFPGIRRYMDETIASARETGYVETLTGRRRYLRDIRSSNATVRGSAERNAINAPIQGTAADMIKLAMVHIHQEFTRRKLKTKMLLQVHDELVFDLYVPEEKEVLELVEKKMRDAIPLEVGLEVEAGVGDNWLEAH
jgi:DNA polymerase-1